MSKLPSLAHALQAAGFAGTVTTWLDADGSVNDTAKHGTLSVDEFANAAARYGNPDGLRVKGWPPRNYVGAHSAGPNAPADQYAAQVLPPYEPSTGTEHWRDNADLNFIEGAAAFVMGKAREMGLYQPAQPPGPTPDPKPTPPAFVPLEIPPNVAETLAMPFEKWPPAEKKAQRGRLKGLREFFNEANGRGLFVRSDG